MEALAIGDYVIDTATGQKGVIFNILFNGKIILNCWEFPDEFDCDEPFNYVVPPNHPLKIIPEVPSE